MKGEKLMRKFAQSMNLSVEPFSMAPAIAAASGWRR